MKTQQKGIQYLQTPMAHKERGEGGTGVERQDGGPQDREREGKVRPFISSSIMWSSHTLHHTFVTHKLKITGTGPLERVGIIYDSFF